MTETPDHFLTLLPSVSIGLLTIALSLAKTGRDALFFQGDGLFWFPMAYMLIGVASLLAASLYIRSMQLWGARACRVGIFVIAALVLATFVFTLRPGHYSVLMFFFAFIPTIFGILFANIWLLAADLFVGAPKIVAARSFSRIGASALAGGMIGGLLAKGLGVFLDPRWLVLFASFAILVAAGVIIETHRRFPATGVPDGPTRAEPVSLRRAFSKRYVRGLLLTAMTGALAGVLIDFLFYATASSAQMDARSNADFFANFYIMLYSSSLVLQLFVAPKIQANLGLFGALMILPLVLLGGATFVSAAATALSRSGLKVAEGGLKASLHRSVWEQAFILVETKERSFVKMFVDGIGSRIAEGIGAVILLLWLVRIDVTDPSALDLGWIAWLVVTIVAVWTLLAGRLRHQAVHSMERGEIECVRFPDQCPCTTEWGKGID